MPTDDRLDRPTGSARRSDDGCAQRYEIRVQGRLGERWAAWFDGLSVAAEPDGTTVLRGEVVDQAALHGLLHKLRDIGLPLVSLTPVAPELRDADLPDPSPEHPTGASR